MFNRLNGEDGIGLTPSGTCLGHVHAVEGSEARIGLAMPFPSGTGRPTVGKFVAIKGRDTSLVGMISEVSLRPEEVNGTRAMARVDLLGEIEPTAGRRSEKRAWRHRWPRRRARTRAPE